MTFGNMSPKILGLVCYFFPQPRYLTNIHKSLTFSKICTCDIGFLD